MSFTQRFLFQGVLLCILLPMVAFATVTEQHLNGRDLAPFIKTKVKDPFTYSGLASFYNTVRVYVVGENQIKTLPESKTILLRAHEWLAVIGHYKALVIKKPGLKVSLNHEKLTLSDTKRLPWLYANISELKNINPALDQLRYAHLWAPFNYLAHLLESLLLLIHSLQPFGWGVAILLFALFFKLCLLPANLLLLRSQRNVSHIQAALAPELKHIKDHYSGQEAHERFMAVHKKHGVTPFYTLKPLALTLFPVPFLISTFNMLGAMDQMAGHSFLWIQDLSRPDDIFELGFHVPFLGSAFNLLPVLMTLLTVVSSHLHHNTIVAPQELKKQKRRLYLMATAFFVLFYAFPSSMVLYWTCMNILSLIQSRVFKI